MFQTPVAQAWADRLERFEQLDVTVNQFCLDEGVTQASYFYWRRKLRDSEPASGGRQSKSLARFIPVSVPAVVTARPRSVMTVDLPGGIRIRFEVPVSDEAADGEAGRS